MGDLPSRQWVALEEGVGPTCADIEWSMELKALSFRYFLRTRGGDCNRMRYKQLSYTRIKIYFALLALDRLDLLLQLVREFSRHLLSLDPHPVHHRLSLEVKADKLDHEAIDRRVELLVDSHVLS